MILTIPARSMGRSLRSRRSPSDDVVALQCDSNSSIVLLGEWFEKAKRLSGAFDYGTLGNFGNLRQEAIALCASLSIEAAARACFHASGGGTRSVAGLIVSARTLRQLCQISSRRLEEVGHATRTGLIRCRSLA